MKTYHNAALGEGEFAFEQLQLGALDSGIFSPAPMVRTPLPFGEVYSALQSGVTVKDKRPWGERMKPVHEKFTSDPVIADLQFR